MAEEIETNSVNETEGNNQGFVATETTTPIEYNFEVMEGLENTPEVQAVFESVKNSLKDTGLAADKAQNLINGVFKTLMDSEDKERSVAQQKFEEGKQALINEWGDKYEATLDKCNDIILKADGGKRNGDFEQAIRDSGINKDPRFVKGLAAIAARFSEDSFVVNNGVGLNRESINDEIRTLMNNPSYLNEYASDHKALVEKVWALRQKLG